MDKSFADAIIRATGQDVQLLELIKEYTSLEEGLKLTASLL